MNKHKENTIREKRTIEATKKNLMGPSGKFGIILQAFGAPVVRQGTSLIDSTFLNDPYEDDIYEEFSSTASGQQGPSAYRDEIKTADFENAYNEGLIFDGLSRGLHLEIVYWHADNQLKVSYKGYPVYVEVAGELEGYAPYEEWESIIERLHSAAKQKVKQNKTQQESEIAEKVQKRKKDFWQNLKMRWGI
jgi:hypothetical protein